MKKPFNIYKKYRIMLKDGSLIEPASLGAELNFPWNKYFFIKGIRWELKEIEKWEEI